MERSARSGDSSAGPAAGSKEATRVFFLMLALLVLPAALTLDTVKVPGTLEIPSQDPTPYGYTVSLVLFLVPFAVLAGWFLRHPQATLQKKAFGLTIAILTPLGFVLDLLFGHVFFEFPNTAATLGIEIPGVGGGIPIEEFVFYLAGFLVVLSFYTWANEYWLAAYNVPDYRAAAGGVDRLLRFHTASVVIGAVILTAGILYKKLFSAYPEGMPWYLVYLVLAAVIPAAGFFDSVQGFINWRAFSFTFFLMLLVSLLWEATLGVPYGWWGYHPEVMTGIFVGAWSGLPLEAVGVWLIVTFTTVIVYEVIKIWLAMDRSAREAFLGR